MFIDRNKLKKNICTYIAVKILFRHFKPFFNVHCIKFIKALLCTFIDNYTKDIS